MDDINWKTTLLSTLSIFGIVGAAFVITVLVFKHPLLVMGFGIGAQALLAFWIFMIKKRKKVK